MFKKVALFLYLLLLMSCVNESKEAHIKCIDRGAMENSFCTECGVHSCQFEIETCANNEDCSKFEHCYESSLGALEGDATKCIEQWPNGAEIWLNFVSCVCDHCCISCYNFCQSPYGILKP